jgi:predicted AlkP superfamily phosphohydrolase/phosphomutase
MSRLITRYAVAFKHFSRTILLASMSGRSPIAPSVVVIGLDCLSPDLLFTRYLSDLPTFRSLLQCGIWGRLRSVDPPVTVPAWSCMLTGLTPAQLGLYGFRHRTLGSYVERYLADSRHVREPRVWQTLAHKGLSSGLLGVPQTWPVAPMCGFVVSDAPEPGPGLAWPPDLDREIQEVAGAWRPDVTGFRCADPDAVLEEIRSVTDERFALFQRLLQTRGADFLMMVDMGPDRIHHRFFRYCDPQHRLHATVAGKPDPVRAYYKTLDDHLAETLRLLPADCRVLVVSDHGARSLQGGFCVNDWLIAQGLLKLRESPGSVRPFDESLVDWPATRAWAWGGYHGRIFVNVQGREPHGTVSPAEVHGFLSDLSQRLHGVRDPAGTPLHNRVLRLQAPDALGDYPDLMVYFGELSYRAIGSVGHRSLFIEGNDTGPDDANHDPHGVFLYRGPTPQPAGERRGKSILHVAPTILSWFGQSHAEPLLQP